MNLVNPKYEALSRGLFAFSDCYSFELNQKCVIAELKFVVNISFSENSYVSNYSEAYRYTFNGKERDAETDLQDYGFRIYDSRLSRFISIDPLTRRYPELTPYQFASNSPIANIDLDGLEAYNASGAEIAWSISHPLAADDFSDNAKIALAKAQELAPVYGSVTDGGADAFRHAYWNALNTKDQGSSLAKQFADLHESSHNDGTDPVAEAMDLHNNEWGRLIAIMNPSASKEELAEKVKEAYNTGKLKKISMDTEGNYLDKDGYRIDKTQDGWEKQKVLVSSNTSVPDAANM